MNVTLKNDCHSHYFYTKYAVLRGVLKDSVQGVSGDLWVVLDKRELPRTSDSPEEYWWAQGRGFSAWGDGKDHLYGREAAADNVTEPRQSRRGGKWPLST